jgi:RNA recognition motif-containing protein
MINDKIYLKNLGYFDTISKLTSAHRKLLEILSACGIVRRIEIFIDSNIGFVEMSTPYETRTAKKYLDGLDFNGKKLIVI